MIFCINAWLDRPDPFISIQNRETGQEVARFNQQELETHMRDGDLYLQDFCGCNTQQLQGLVKELLLLRCCNVMRIESESPKHDFLTYNTAA